MRNRTYNRIVNVNETLLLKYYLRLQMMNKIDVKIMIFEEKIISLKQKYLYMLLKILFMGIVLPHRQFHNRNIYVDACFNLFICVMVDSCMFTKFLNR